MPETAPDQPLFVRRVGLVGDVHGYASALAAALDYLAAVPDLDAILCTGDVPGESGDGDVARACRLLAKRGVRAVAGNHDRWAVENESGRVLIGTGDDWPLEADALAYLKTLPATLELDTPRGPALLCHGTGDDDLTGIYPCDDENALAANHRLHALHGEGRVRFLLAGHTHQRMVRPVDHLTIINAGALACEEASALPIRISRGTALRMKNPCFSVVDFDAGTVQFYNIHRDGHAVREGERLAF